MSGVWNGRGRGRGGAPNTNRAPQNNTGQAYPPLAGPRQAQPGINAVTRNMANMDLSGRGGGGASRGEPARGGRQEGAQGAVGVAGGEVAGRRGARKGRSFADKVDLVNSRPSDRPSKCGSGGTRVQLIANFFPMKTTPDWILYNHRVDFRNAQEGGAEETRTFVKKRLLAQQREILGLHIFDGSNLYTISRLNPDPLILASQRNDGATFELTIRFVTEVSPIDITYLQFFNIIMRRCLSSLKFEQIGRHYYDHGAHINLQRDAGVILIPGYITNIRQFEERLMMCVETTHKVLRTDTCWDIIRNEGKAFATEVLVSGVVLTRYNNKTYRVDDILWDQTPRKTFLWNGNNVSLANYYQNKYQLNIQNMDQPLLQSNPRRRDIHRGDNSPILLIPELCMPTGLLDSDRRNFRKMQLLSKYLQQNPPSRVSSIQNFMDRLRSSDETRGLLSEWGLEFEGRELVTINEGRVLPPETLTFSNQAKQPVHVKVNELADWTSEMRTDSSSKMATAQPLTTAEWVIIVSSRDAGGVDHLVQTMRTLGTGMGFPIAPPAQIMVLNDARMSAYLNALEEAKNKHKELKLLFTIIPFAKDTTDLYNKIKKRCLSQYGILNQCFRQTHIQQNNIGRLRSVVTKLLVQINAKRGGEPWKTLLDVVVPTMIVGFDVYHPGKRSSGKSYGAMVASMNRTVSRFYSTVTPQNLMDEISTRLEVDIIKCVKAFVKQNGDRFPTTIFFYRDGVGEGQLSYVYNMEVAQVQKALKEYYETLSKPPPKLVFIVVTKKGNARILCKSPGQNGRQNYTNPNPGTVVDNTITLPERYDFFLIAQQARKDQTVSPTAFNVLHDDLLKTPAEIQALTFKLCHMYYNWSGTVAVPAVCQYAHKLAYLTGTALDASPAEGGGSGHNVQPHLLNYLYYL